MRCDEVIRELAVPTDDCDSAMLWPGIWRHVGPVPIGPKRAGQLDRLWEATRPTEPMPEIWDAVWAHVSAALVSTTFARG